MKILLSERRADAALPTESFDDNGASGPDTYTPPRILLVDDDEAVRDLFCQLLEMSGYQVDTAGDGEAGWQALYAESYTPDGYDLLITDNNMPKLTGIGLIKKARSEGLNLPIILASGNVPANTETLRLAAILAKPFTPDVLVQTVKKALRTSARQKSSFLQNETNETP